MVSNILNVDVGFSSCLFQCIKWILNNRIFNFWRETSFCSLLSASSSLKKMFSLQILIHHRVYGKMFLPIILWIMADSIANSGRC